MHTRAVRARRHGLVPEVPGHDLLRELRPPGTTKAHEIFGADWDYARVAATTGGTGQAIELFTGVGQDVEFSHFSGASARLRLR